MPSIESKSIPRHWIDRSFVLAAWASAGLCSLLLAGLLAAIVWKGFGAIDPEFLLTRSRDFGAAGGIFYQIAGSGLLVAVAALLCFPVALGTALFKSEYLRSAGLQRLSTLLVYGLTGVPSIVFGIFGLLFFVNVLGTGVSWFVGSIILAMMMLPTVVQAAYQSIESIPTMYRESARALGLSKWQLVARVLLPQGLSGAITGLFLGLARAVGETAPIMFIATAYSGVDVPGSLFEPVTALPTHLLALAQQATDAQALQNAWGTSLVLLCLVTGFSMLGLLSRTHLRTISQR